MTAQATPARASARCREDDAFISGCDRIDASDNLIVRTESQALLTTYLQYPQPLRENSPHADRAQ
jgi:hypothetical protein